MLKKILSVSQLNAYLKGVFEDELILHDLCVCGEVEDVRVSNGTTYFTLREQDTRLSCVMFSVYELPLKGLKVELLGGVSFYAKTARISFVTKSIRLTGEGEQHLALLKIKDRLEKEGLFLKKKQFPVCIISIAVITSETGAVIHDFVSVLRANGIAADIKILPIRVQGTGAADEILKATETVNRHNFCDIAVFMRGGGAEADLEAFNAETVARAVAACNVCTLSAVGHETNWSLCDLAADMRAGTPSIAAQMIAERMVKTNSELAYLVELLAIRTEQLYNKKYARLIASASAVDNFAQQKILLADQKVRFLFERLQKTTDALILKKSELLKIKSERLIIDMDKLTDFSDKKLETASYRLDAQSPLKMLAKGYARAEKNGVPIVKAGALKQNDQLDLFYCDGKAAVTVTEIKMFQDEVKNKA